jgi:hypothetical protein
MRLVQLWFVLFILAGCEETKAISANGAFDETEADGDGDGDGDDGADDGSDDGADDGSDGGVDDADADDGADPGQLFLLIDAYASIAGETVAYTVSWEAGDGSLTAVTAFELTSDLQSDLDFDDTHLTPTIAGSHTFTVTAIDPSGDEQEDTAGLSVAAAPASAITLALSASEVAAGEPVTATVTAHDEYGNEASTEDVVLTATDDVEVEGDTLVSTTAAEHTATATLDDLNSEATWTVVAGPAVAIDLVLEDTDLDMGDATDYTISLTDTYGNPADGDITVSADAGVTVDEIEATFTFNEEGVFTLVAEVTDTETIDTEVVVIDSEGPELTIFTPERAQWGTDVFVEMTGQAVDTMSWVDSLTVNGESVTPEDDGSFTTGLDLSFGINIFETIASDAAPGEDDESNQTIDVRSVLQANDFRDTAVNFENGLIVRMWEGEGGLGHLESMAPALMDGVDLDALVEGELYANEGCITFIFWPVCWDVAVVGESIDYDDISMNIDATDAGTLDTRATMSDVEMIFQITGEAPFVSLPSEGVVTIDAIHIDISFTPVVTDGALHFTDITISVPEPDVTVTVEEGIGTLIGYMGIDMEAMIAETIVTAIEDAMEGVADGLFDDLLGSFNVEQDFEVSDMTYTLFAGLHDAEVDELGLTLRMQTRVVPEEVLSAGAIDSVDGIPYYGFEAPSFDDGGSGTNMGISTDVLNQMMFAFWQGGMLDQILTEDDLGIDPSLIGLLLPGVDSLNVVTTPLLPPVIVPRDDVSEGPQFDLQIGSLMTSIHDGEITDDSLAMEMYVAAEVPLTLSIDEDAGIVMSLGEAEVLVDMTYARPDLASSAPFLEGLLGGILAEYLPDMTSDLGSIPMPELDGFSLAVSGSEMAGTDTPPGYWLLLGGLE